MNKAPSPLALKILDANPEAYQSLVVSGPTRPQARQLLAGVQPKQLLIAPIQSPDDASAMLAALWLWHDALAESHAISQSIHSKTGSYWHAIMHRREGDFSNSKYWYAKAAGHPALEKLATKARPLAAQFPADRQLSKLLAPVWNSAAFVDLVESIYETPGDPRHRAAVELQKLEWQTLFDFCCDAAIAQT